MLGLKLSCMGDTGFIQVSMAYALSIRDRGFIRGIRCRRRLLSPFFLWCIGGSLFWREGRRQGFCFSLWGMGLSGGKGVGRALGDKGSTTGFQGGYGIAGMAPCLRDAV